MSVYYKGILPLASDLYKIHQCLDFRHIFLDRDVPKSKQSNWPTERKYLVMTLDYPGISGGESVFSVF